MAEYLPAPDEADFLFYAGPDGTLNIEVIYGDETVWLSQEKMARLFNKSRATINEHIGNIYTEGELVEAETMKKFGNPEFSTKPTNYYNLDVIISVGYRVKSLQGTQFRQWATARLHEYIIKGFVMDDERLKNGTHFGKDYFEELLERIREIRLSERRLHLKLTDIFALASDYDKTGEITKEFFAFIQNKLHYAVTGQTAAEIVHNRADKAKLHMGLTNWKRSPDGKVLKSDVTVAKNYLTDQELSGLRRAVTAFLDIAESRAERRLPTSMAQWIDFMNGYLDLNEYPKLAGAGKVSKAQAETKASKEYDEFRIRQDQEFIGDFEKQAKALKNPKTDS